MVRTREWKYVHRYPDGPHELYHLPADPDERANIVDAPERQALRAEMRRRLDEWFAQFVDPLLDGASKNVTGCGQLGAISGGPGDREKFAQEPIQALAPGRARSWRGDK